MKSGLRLSDSNFKQEVLDFSGAVLVDFWGSWCPPCKMTEPVVEELAEEFKGRLKVGKINVDQNRKTADEFNVAGVPTFMLFKEGKELKREVGARSKKQLIKVIEELGL